MDPHQGVALLLQGHYGRQTVCGEMSTQLLGTHQPPREGQDGPTHPRLHFLGRACSQVGIIWEGVRWNFLMHFIQY